MLKEFGRDYLARAKERLTMAEGAFERGSYPEVIRLSQEATELSLKAVLRLVGIEYPKVHDVSDVLVISKDVFPGWFAGEVPRVAEFSRIMAEKRSIALYGVEASEKPPGEVFNDPKEARQDLDEAERVHSLCLRVFEKS